MFFFRDVAGCFAILCHVTWGQPRHTSDSQLLPENAEVLASRARYMNAPAITARDMPHHCIGSCIGHIKSRPGVVSSYDHKIFTGSIVALLRPAWGRDAPHWRQYSTVDCIVDCVL